MSGCDVSSRLLLLAIRASKTSRVIFGLFMVAGSQCCFFCYIINVLWNKVVFVL